MGIVVPLASILVTQSSLPERASKARNLESVVAAINTTPAAVKGMPQVIERAFQSAFASLIDGSAYFSRCLSQRWICLRCNEKSMR